MNNKRPKVTESKNWYAKLIIAQQWNIGGQAGGYIKYKGLNIWEGSEEKPWDSSGKILTQGDLVLKYCTHKTLSLTTQ